MNLTWLLFSFNGRISRGQFWMVSMIMFLILIIPGIIFFGSNSLHADQYVTLMTLILLWPSLAIQAKRWHDIDYSAWWILINLFPFIGSVMALIANGFLSGTEGSNRFGDNQITYKSTNLNET